MPLPITLFTRHVFSIRYYVLLILLAIFSLPVQAESIAEKLSLKNTLVSDNSSYQIRLDSAMTLSNIMINQHKVSELSGLYWDEDEKILYALSDNGFLLHLKPVFHDKTLTEIELINGYPLLDEKNKPLKYKPSDSEGLTATNANNHKKGDTELLVSFERIPRIIKYRPDGVMSGKLELPQQLQDIKNYQSENKSLEAIVYHPKYGVLTGPEIALKNENTENAYIYSLGGRIWEFPLHDSYNGALVDMALMPDNQILALERVYGGFIPSINISLHALKLSDDKIESADIYTFTPDENGFNDNFEGITHYRDNHYFMVSDDNDHPLSRTVLLYFSIIKKD